MSEIANLSENWEGHSGYEVEAFIKRTFGTKYGDFRTTAADANNHIHLLCFATTEDAALYDSDPEQYASLILKDLTIPINVTQGDSYISNLAVQNDTTINYIVADGDDFNVNLRFQAVLYRSATGDRVNYGGNGTINIERSKNGGDYEQVGTAIVASQEPTAETYPFTLNLGQYLAAGANNAIRLSAYFNYTDAQGNSGVATSTYTIINIQSVSLQLACTSQWESIIYGASRNDFPLSYNILGAVAKTLHISITGGESDLVNYTLNYGANDQGAKEIHVPDQARYALLSHGVHTVQAWLTASNGNGGTLTTPVVVNQFMVVNPNTTGADLMAPMLLIQGMIVENGLLKATAENFVQSTLLGYAVYSPSVGEGGVIVNNGDPISLTFKLTNSNQDILTVEQTEYATVPTIAQPNNQYSLGMTVEIEQAVGEEVAEYFNSFLHVIRTLEGTDYDFLLESTGTGYALVEVDNTGGFQPTAGSTFLINPKTRSNTEANPERILNARNNNAVVESTWTGFHLGDEDGWITDGTEQNNKILRIPAGRTLNIQFNPFSQFRTARASSMTLDIDFAVRNVTNEDDPIVQICEIVDGLWRGLRMRPMVGTITTESKIAVDEADFRWQEGERTHISLNIVNGVSPNVNDDGWENGTRPNIHGSMSLIRVFINGVINRELQFSTESFDEFCTGAMSNNGITIGQNGADIDIYGIRCWQEKFIDSAGCVQNWVSTLPSSEEKRKVKALNNIIDPTTGQISIDYITGSDRIEGIHKNILLWHGNEPYHDNVHKDETGWLEIWRYDDNGNYLPELSGTICKDTMSCPQKRQGTTANTYYYSNIQFKIDKISDTITIPVSKLHDTIQREWVADYQWLDGDDQPTGEVGAWKLKGGYLGKNYPLPTESWKYYHGTSTTVIVPDGWIDGNGKYRGMGYMVAEGYPMAQKMVNKINYASSMQSHLIGVNWLYNELHAAVVGKNALQDAVNGAVVAKHTEPFLFFVQQEGASAPVFRGPCAFGAGKMDKPSWGYVKSAYPNFCMIEGADNDKPLTDMRVPFDNIPHGNQPAKVFYDPDEEAYIYRAATGNEKSIDFDGGATREVTVDGKVKEYPKTEIEAYIKRAWDFLYLHAPRIRYFDGSFAEFVNSSEATNTQNKYWCKSTGGNTTGDYLLKRYDFVDQQWVDAGLWDEENEEYEAIDLRTYSMTASTWNNMTSAEKAALDVCNQKFVDAIVADCNANIGDYFDVQSLRFHYAFENHFIAGTDNCSKNTYYVLVPVVRNNETVWLFQLHQDDVDTTLATDNSGLQLKPYYIDRMHPYAGQNSLQFVSGSGTTINVLRSNNKVVKGDHIRLVANPNVGATVTGVFATTVTVDSTDYNVWRLTLDKSLGNVSFGDALTSDIASRVAMTSDIDVANCLYEGYYNALFDLVELMWEENSLELQSMMRSVFGAMAALNGGIHNEETDSLGGVWRAVNRYLFNIQRYFPQMVFNEAARIRYEFPTMIGFKSDNREVVPITQSLGDQLQSEMQFMKRRLVYMSSYAAFGEFRNMSDRPALAGVPDMADAFSMMHKAIPGTTVPSVYNFDLIPHQWLYPVGGVDNDTRDPHKRVAPDPSNPFRLSITPSNASDNGVSVYGLNFYRSLGNVGDMVTNDASEFVLNGKRLTEFYAEPTMYYSLTSAGTYISAADYEALSDEAKQAYAPCFRVMGFSIGSATRLNAISLKGASLGGGNINLGSLSLVESIDLRQTDITRCVLPKTTTLTTLKFPSKMTSLSIDGLPSLTSVTMEGYDFLQSLYLNDIGVYGGSGSADLFRNIYNAQRLLDTQTFTSLTAYGIDWGGITSPHVNWMLNLSQLDLKGSITIQSGDTISFASVISLMDKFGDITRTENPNNPLFVSYAKSEIGNPSITGEKDVRHTGEWTGWGVKTEWGNNVGVRYYAEKGKYVPNITWSLSARDIDDSASSSSYAEMTDNSKGYLNVLQVQDAFEYVEWDTDKFVWRDVLHFEFVMTVNIVSVTNETYTVTKKVRFSNRAPQVCDFAWHDGTFDNEADISKKLVGAVVMRELLFPEDAVEGVTPPNAVRAWVYAKENVNLSSNLAGDSSPISNMYQMAWGMYVSDSAGNNGFTAAFLNGDDVFGTIDGLSASYVANTPIPDVTSTGQSSSYITDKPNNVDTDFIDRSEYDGFKKYASGVLKDIDKSADYKSEIMQIATRIINLYIKGKQLTCTIDGQTVRVLADDEVVDTPTKLANAMRKMAIRASGYVKNYQFFFPATYACHVYRPSGMESVTLNAQYEQGKWMLPSEGLLGRIFNFYYNSVGTGRPRTTAGNTISTTYDGGSGVNPNLEYIGDVKKEALMCLFSIIRKRLQGTGLSFSMPSASTYWSSSEYNTTYAWNLSFGSGRVYGNNKYTTDNIACGVAAFIFNL